MDSNLASRIGAIIAKAIGVAPERLTPEATLFGDMGVDGADGWELIEAFGAEFGADLSGFEPAKHFGPECGASFSKLLTWIAAEFLGKRETHEVAGLVRIRVRDLVDAAEAKRWLLHESVNKGT